MTPLSSLTGLVGQVPKGRRRLSSRQCKESHRCCCHGPLAPLTMGDSGTSTVLTRYETMPLQSLRQSERTTARDRYNTRDKPIRAIGRSIRNINKDGRTDGVRRLPNIWQKIINKGDDYIEGTHMLYPCE